MWLLIRKIIVFDFGIDWRREKEKAPFGKPKRNSTGEKLVPSQYNGTRTNMIRRDKGNRL